jgi:hypothetical protein
MSFLDLMYWVVDYAQQRLELINQSLDRVDDELGALLEEGASSRVGIPLSALVRS